MVYGYVSYGVLNNIKESNIENQISSILENYNTANIIVDKFIDNDFSESNLIRLVRILKCKDELVVSSINNLAYSSYFLPILKKILEDREISFKILDTHEQFYEDRLNSIMTVERKSHSRNVIDEKIKSILFEDDSYNNHEELIIYKISKYIQT